MTVNLVWFFKKVTAVDTQNVKCGVLVFFILKVEGATEKVFGKLVKRENI